MNEIIKLNRFRIFLRVYGIIIILVMTINSTAFLFRILEFNPGGKLHWLIWDSIDGHVGPMIFVIYIVWGVYLILASDNPVKYRTFLDFTMWANIAHGILMIPMALNESTYHSKMLTDIPFLLLLSLGIYLLKPETSKVIVYK